MTGVQTCALPISCRSLQTAGADVLILTTNADGDQILPVTLGQTLIYKGVPTVFFHRQWSEAVKYSRPLSRWLNQHVGEFDLVHIHAVFSHACVAAANACRKHKIPYIVRPLGTLDPWSLKQKRFRKQIFWHLGVKQMLRRAAAIHYTTAEEKRLVESELGVGNGVVIPNGIDLEQAFQHSALNASPHQAIPASQYVLALSRIHPKKGYELLIESFGAVKGNSAFKDWQLVIAGDGDAGYINQLKQLAKRNGLNGDVRFVGWLDGERKYAALKHSALLALPSYQENFGISLIEAMACGVPVLVSPHVNLAPEIAATEAGWVASLNSEMLKDTLMRALENAPERQRRGRNGQKLAGDFAAERVASDLLQLYRTLIGTCG